MTYSRGCVTSPKSDTRSEKRDEGSNLESLRML